MLKISVIVPIYRSRESITTALKSVVNQTLKDIELILIDDCGGDDTIEIARRYLEYEKPEFPIKYLYTPRNLGPGGARNVGIDVAEGEYVAFLDGDDVLDVHFCEKMYSSAAYSEADICYCHIYKMKSKGRDQICCNPIVGDGEFDLKKKIFYLTHYTSYFTTYIYRREFLNIQQIRFPQSRSSEDSAFLAEAIISAITVSNVLEPLYIYRISDQTISRAKNPKRYLDRISSFGCLMSYAKSRGYYNSLKDELEYIYIKKCYLLSLMSYLSNCERYDRAEAASVYTKCAMEGIDVESNPYIKGGVKMIVKMLYSMNTFTLWGMRVFLKLTGKRV